MSGDDELVFDWELRPGHVLLVQLDDDQARAFEGELPGPTLMVFSEACEVTNACRIVARHRDRVVFDETAEVASLLGRVPEVVSRELADRPPQFAREMCWRWIVADQSVRDDMLSFYESGGPEMMRQSRLKFQDGIPTAADLEGMLEVEGGGT